MEELNIELLEDEEIDITADITDDFLKGDKGDKGEPGKDGADYDDSELRVLIQNNTKDINDLSTNKAEKLEVETLNAQVQTNIDNISNLDSIKANKEDLNNTNTQVLNNKTDIEILNENKADKGAIPDVSQFITDEEADVLLKNLQEKLQEEIGNLSLFDLLVVNELPTENIQEKTIYLTPNTETTENNVYDEYIYVNGTWEVIGSTAVDTDNLTVNLVENSYDLTLTEAVAGGGTITLPSMYKVGFDRLDVYLNGEKLIKAETSDTEGHYYEVGTEGTLSNVIRITNDWTAEVGDVFEFTIRTNGEAEIETGVGEIENGVVLWENPNPTAEISTSGLAITLDESLFDIYEVYYKPQTTTTNFEISSRSEKGKGCGVHYVYGSSIVYRNIQYVSENNYLIQSANLNTGGSGDASKYTSYLIPVKIIGY